MTPRIGTAGWTLPAKPSAEGSHLHHYAQTLNCVEINTTFYRPHRPATFARWAAETPPDFRFSVKAPKTITHEAKLRDPEPLLRAFLDQIGPIRPKLGPILFQLPPSLALDSALAADFLATVRELYPGDVALEPRHATWFSAESDTLLRLQAIARVAADPAKASEHAFDPGGDPNLAYYRLHGSPRTYYSSYDDAFLSTLAARIAPHRNAWVIFDNTAHGHAYPNALRLQQNLQGFQRP
ncbi:DUF72 domain-containing protein [Occallatibacter riparius]|uniref:DUF72 domain-containing protein n=1 Tax=Occallatibacter riparius TaxID=1002689 RepID=A0A9J7BJG9_9BACT|nr:DUF72 domain-containing protein [Occallatibacter riparius]UWZ83052.1 DUF72 domain-containing protein [Occallatibacter riparius]